MEVLRITTENPELEQWRLLSQFTYPANVFKHLQAQSFSTVDTEIVELIAGCFRQGEAFFAAASRSPLDISPLLLYYGAANLLAGLYALLTNSKPNITNHGMTIPNMPASRIADVQILPRSPLDGALQLFCNIFSSGCRIVNGATWTVGEVIGSLPDLKIDFQDHYSDLLYHSLPVETIYTQTITTERIANFEFDRYSNANNLISLVPDFKKAYLPPQFKSDFIILHARQKGIPIGTHSISGRKYLQIGHDKNGQILCPNQLILMHMGLFALGFLPRYRSNLWNNFVRTDTTGEKRVIEKFLFVCQRYLPHLALNFIYGKRIVFVNEMDGVIDRTRDIQKSDIKDIVRELLQDMRNEDAQR